MVPYNVSLPENNYSRIYIEPDLFRPISFHPQEHYSTISKPLTTAIACKCLYIYNSILQPNWILNFLNSILKMETISSFETRVSTDMTTQLHNREYGNQKTRGFEDVQSYKNYVPSLTYQSVLLLYVPQ